MASSAKDIQLRELKDMVSQLKTMVSEQTEMIRSLRLIIDEKSSHEKALQEQVDYLTQKLFGSSSERRSDDIPGQQNLFDEAEMEQDPTAAEAEELAASLPEKEAKKRKSRSTDAERFKGIPVTKKYLDLPDADKFCPVCNTPLVKIGEGFVRRELVFIPAKLKAVEIYSINYTCPKCGRRDLPVIKKGKMADHICSMEWLLLVRLHG